MRDGGNCQAVRHSGRQALKASRRRQPPACIVSYHLRGSGACVHVQVLELISVLHRRLLSSPQQHRAASAIHTHPQH